MKSQAVKIGAALAMAAGFAAISLFAQAPAARDFEAEIRTSLQSAKNAARFEFLGTLARTCLLPQSGGENTTDILPGYVSNPASAPARDTWYAEPAWSLTTSTSSAARSTPPGR